MHRCIGIAVILALFAPLSSSAATDVKSAAPSAAERMQQPGPEEQQLKRRTGTWTVKATFRPTPDAQPMITDHLVADRKMVGLYMEEVMHPDAGAQMPTSNASRISTTAAWKGVGSTFPWTRAFRSESCRRTASRTSRRAN